MAQHSVPAGSAQGVFGSAGNANFLSRSTAVAATFFFATCMAMVYIHTHSNKHGFELQRCEQTQRAPKPATQNNTTLLHPNPQQQ